MRTALSVLLLPLLPPLSAGGAWNHALYFRHFAPANSEKANPGPSVSAELNNDFDRSFDGDVQEMKAAFTAAANRIFGSGWAWLCYTGALLSAQTYAQRRPQATRGASSGAQWNPGVGAHAVPPPCCQLRSAQQRFAHHLK